MKSALTSFLLISLVPATIALTIVVLAISGHVPLSTFLPG